LALQIDIVSVQLDHIRRLRRRAATTIPAIIV
jgi:hypothetical protein